MSSSMRAANYFLGSSHTNYSIAPTNVNNFLFPSVWNLDHFEPNLLISSEIELNFTWTCHPAGTSFLVTHSLVPIDGDASYPSWVVLNSLPLKLILQNTPNDSSSTNYRFGLRSSWATGRFGIKRFYLTVSL
jgi:hypothetical protein